MIPWMGKHWCGRAGRRILLAQVGDGVPEQEEAQEQGARVGEGGDALHRQSKKGKKGSFRLGRECNSRGKWRGSAAKEEEQE